MKRASMVVSILALVLSTTPRVSTAGPEATPFDDSEVLHVEYPEWFNEGFLDLEHDLETARDEGRSGLMVLFTTDGCSYCDLFIREALGDPGIARRVRERFDSVGMEIFSDDEMTAPDGETLSVKQFADSQGAEYSPTLLFFGEGGQRRLRLVGYQSPERFGVALDYLLGEHDGSMSYPDFVLSRRGPAEAGSEHALRLDPMFRAQPYALDRSRVAASKPLLVIFESANCAECATFHDDVLSVPDIRRRLARFEVVRLDAEDPTTPVSTPGGDRANPAGWFESTGFSRLPAMLFFDEQGNEVLCTDALVLEQRMTNSLDFVLDRVYEKGWTYQRFARSRGAEKARNRQAADEGA
ncbi:MAG: thioredoxin fold domain-containing protein [Pseudomonadota bacterium]|nr:thioredoxin fold domain-containing protein [Pseudomonadota bacterium]